MSANVRPLNRQNSTDTSSIDAVTEVTSLLERWNRENSSGADPIPILTRLSEIVEKETESWYKMDPDPFDDRHPGRADPNCGLGHVLKAIFKNDDFMNKLVSNYIVGCRPEEEQLKIVACRLLLDVLPGLETSVVFQENESMVRKLCNWAATGDIELRSYSTGLLAGAMEVQDVAANFREQNSNLVPLMLKRLKEIRSSQKKTDAPNLDRPFANLGKKTSHSMSNGNRATVQAESDLSVSPPSKRPKLISPEKQTSNLTSKIRIELPKAGGGDASANFSLLAPSDHSNSSWAEVEPYVIGSYCMNPMGPEMQQRLILQYLSPMGEYQEYLGHVIEHNAMQSIFYYIDLTKNKDVRLAFETLRYLAALLCHKKFAMEFIALGGLQRLLEVYRPSVAATGVSMCLYYLAYFEDAMERVCLLPRSVLVELVSYALWLLECSHESGRIHATMFFGVSFPFQVILELFDRQDGLRKLFNMISTLQIMNQDGQPADLTDDDLFSSRQAARHVCVALKRYFEAHLAIKASQVRLGSNDNDDTAKLSNIVPHKPNHLKSENVLEDMETMLAMFPIQMRWGPVSHFLKLGGMPLMLSLVAYAAEWTAYNGKAETIRCALDVLAVLSVSPRAQMCFSDTVALPENMSTPAMSIILGVAEGEIIIDPDVQKSALNVICNCVCGPTSKFPATPRYTPTSSKKVNRLKSAEDLLARLWSLVRTNNGIMVLLKLLMVKTPITEADAIRAKACKALLGLSRSEKVRQIISKLPLFSNGQLQQLMKEPVLQDKRAEHVKFCNHAKKLIERVSGKPENANMDASLEHIRRASVVAQTKIMYHDKELLQLIYEHLYSKGYLDSATMLKNEAKLIHCSTPPPIHPKDPCIFSTPGPLATPKAIRTQNNMMGASPSYNFTNSGSRSSQTVTPNTPLGPIRVNIKQNRNQNSPGSQLRSRRMIMQKQEFAAIGTQSPLQKLAGQQRDPAASLDKIVTGYLREQHATCRNPVSTCPPFSLLKPHRCPTPKHRNSAPTNITSRLYQRSVLPRHGGAEGQKANRKFIYSKFRSIRSYREAEEDGCFSCCAFSACEQYLMLGSYSGELKMYNLQSGEEEQSFTCHTSPLTHIERTRDGRLVLTSSPWGTPLSALWSMGSSFDLQHSFSDDYYVEFNKSAQDKIIGTDNEKAHIYDVTTGKKIVELYDQDKANNYTRNRATFSPMDDLVLNDGVLWDVNSAKPIHKFDKFNPNISGVFHPKGLEIIINSEVWDLRSFHLLHTVPALDECDIRFNSGGDVIFGAIHQSENDDDDDSNTLKSPFGSSFRTFDATDYSNICTFDVKKNIYDLCTDSSDCYLAVIENQRSPDTLAEESSCKLYEVGCMKDEEEEQVDDDEEEEGLDDDDDDDPELDSILDDSIGDDGDSDADNAEVDEDEDDDNNEDGNDDDDDDDEELVIESSSNSDDEDDIDEDSLFEIL